MAHPESTRVVALIIPRALVKTVKSVLEAKGWFGKNIERMHGNANGGGGAGAGDDHEEFRVYTGLSRGNDGGDVRDNDMEVLRLLGLESYVGRIRVTFITTPGIPGGQATATSVPPRNPLDFAISTFLHTHVPACPLEVTAALYSSAPRRWSFYPPLALLPPTAFTSPSWTTLLSTLSPALKSTLYGTIATALSATHLAINAPIPASSALRSPSNLTPLHGDFGPQCTAAPTETDFQQALWCNTRQNGIFQTWAPRYTMFSRGNVKEKARVLQLPQVSGQTVVDLYAGIGYFAFSYVAAGAARVWCWEMNPWSCEALCRGARGNGWGVKLVHEGEEEVMGLGEECRLVVFMESNRFAGERLQKMGVVGVRHVNLGLLPTSVGSWEPALGMVSRKEGGWVHVHANVAEGEIEEYTTTVLHQFEAMEDKRENTRAITCEHVEQVKTFAPGVMHCVLDLHIGWGD